MKLTGQVYYWLIFSGLLLGLILSVLLYPSSNNLDLNHPVQGTVVVATLAISWTCYLVVAFEIWNRFGLGIAFVCHVIFPLTFIYWLSRLKGRSDSHKAT